MSQPLPDESPAAAASRRPLLLLAAALVLVAAFLGGRVLAPLLRGTGGASPGPTPSATREAPPRPAAPVAQPEASPVTETPAARPRAARKSTARAPEQPAAPAAPTTGELKIDSDVPGAMVFLDRVYLGAAPVTAPNVTPGTHHLNVSAEGYEGQSQTLEVAPGTAAVMVRFKEIRLNEAMEVVHKHGIGSCEGRLVADPNGLRFETINRDDAFALKFAEVEVFQVDYLKKNLRVKRRGGKTWNFTTKAENADPLFVFHRNVEKVRQKLAQ